MEKLKQLEGYRTIIAAVVSALVIPFLAKVGIPVGAEDAATLTGIIMGIIMILMRVITKTPLPWKKDE